MRAILPVATLVCVFGAVLPACGAGGGGGGAGRPATPDLAIAPLPAPVTTTDDRSCADSAARSVASLRAPLRITAYVTTGHPKLTAFVARLRSVLEELRAAGGDVSVAVANTNDEAHAAKAKEAGLQRFEFGEAETKRLTGYLGVVVEYGAERDSIKLLPLDIDYGLAFLVQNKIREVRRRAEASKITVGVLTGHGEASLGETNLLPPSKGKSSLRGIIEQYFPEYQFVDVDTKGGTVAIDTSRSALLVLQPDRDLGDPDLGRIDDYVLAGKRVVVVASAVNVKAGDPTLHATLSTHGLEKLLAGYGIEMRRDVVEDYGRPFKVEVMTTTSPTPLTARFPPILNVRDDERFTGDEQLFDTGFPAFFRIPEIAFPFASSLVLHPERQPDLKPGAMRILARSTPQADRETTTDVDLGIARRWAPKVKNFAQHAVAAVVTGKLRSAFPPKTATSQGESSVLVISSSQFFANPFARAVTPSDDTMTALAMPYAQQVLTSTILVMKNTLDWMSMDADLQACARRH